MNALAADNKNITVEQLDVTDHPMIDALAEKYVDQPIDLLLNNAGIGGESSDQVFGRMNFDTFDRVMDVNVKGPMKMCQSFRKHVRASICAACSGKKTSAPRHAPIPFLRLVNAMSQRDL